MAGFAEFMAAEWWVLGGVAVIGLLMLAIVRVLLTNRDRALALAGAMTEPLRRANERLETRVAERTRELAAANGRLLAEAAKRRDVESSRRRALAREQEARAEAEAANRAKDEFMATLSHELRTPLNAIQSWAQVLEQDVRPQTVRRGAAAIKRNVENQTRLIDDLLESARVSAGKMRLEQHSVALGELVASVTGDLQPTASEQGVRIHTAIVTPDARVSGDSNRLRQIAWNLLSNAIKFTPAGGTIDVGLARREGCVRFSVTDTGEGIEPAFLPHVFAPFRQADGSSRRRQGGLGLGLALVKKMVELHGGAIEVASAGRGHGTTFVVSLPEEVDAGSPRPDQRPATAQRPAERLADCAILAVEDHADALDALTAVLKIEGARVAAADSSRTALSFLERVSAAEAPDVILCDIALPDEDGYAFLEELRALEKRRGVAEADRIPVIAVTAYAQREHRERTLAAGFAAHVPKPVDTNLLVEAVGRACSGRHDTRRH
jgi:signal transduction histidine kinase/CheY-like chemotaxis protein